ncbi:precorrin-6y C5,15-methyltransferase (decarboxylating) subunit CbiE [Roseinatronobacter alkalisoli]|uniref:Precorrin-6y C5,15-methyltransferase (Decarboxylating) subunit CbiE n=1 Tax=Roseinatronobacter alkalisoli TaxID=3028235 RepID=A0ABT5T766_9RHOB|nr:precorrin-6y C5,15-methyltransferase (decarboxylating) subunit CbiE [Roseinatronobacter sp. HJB301]MDD7970789.1 precorrin-6y C5,15-methyltransferase (decarboxylating) subunit CbiE [Roseinatronobacter sp. HJB301]
MADGAPWLTIIGLGEDGLKGLGDASREALEKAELVMGARRHLALLPGLDCAVIEWPVPFADGIAGLLAQRGRAVVMLASGDPFWFGAGTSVTRHLDPGEWVALPAPSTFSQAAASLGWPLENVACLGLHAAPLTRLRPCLVAGARAVVLLRDGDAVAGLARYLDGLGFGASRMHVLEALGGPRARHRIATAQGYALHDVAHPVAVGLEVAGDGRALPVTAGLPDDMFLHDGQITKRAVRALTLSALAPRAGDLLWDIGSGSGSVGIEWLLAHPLNTATGFEADPQRAARARENAATLGADRLQVVEGRAPQVLRGQPLPDAVFIGGGLSEALLTELWHLLPQGVRVVANAVTLESEALLGAWHRRAGGTLLRFDLAEAAALGQKRGWRAAYPIVQWSVTR